MKNIIFLFLFLCVSCNLHSQWIEGVLLDAKTKEPIADANIYYDGTSIRARSDKKGNFRISDEGMLNTNLVISHVVYEKKYLSRPFDMTPKILYLEEKEVDLNDVVIVADIFTWKQKIEAFRKAFLGSDWYGKQCVILNEKDIRIRYDEDRQMLHASSDKPIVIENEALAYTLEFTLLSLQIHYKEPLSLSNSNELGSVFYGTSMFIDNIENGSKKKNQIRSRRNEIYVNSPQFFYKSLVNESLKEAKFKLYRGSFGIRPEDCFVIKDTLSMKKVSLIGEKVQSLNAITDKTKGRGPLQDEYLIQVADRKRKTSNITFYTNSFLVDRFGNTDDVESNIVFSGEFSKYKIGRMLPIEYETK